MAKKKKTIVHLREITTKALCGQRYVLPFMMVYSMNRLVENIIKTDLNEGERLYHKCKYIHKQNLTKEK